jgi:hypothetical protein
MTIRQFAQTIIDDPAYRETVKTRAQAGTLPLDVEMFLLEMADGRQPVSADRAGGESVQSRTLALVRPLAFGEEVRS